MRASRLISRPLRWSALVAVAALAALPPGAVARGHHHGHELAGYQQRNLVADTPGAAEVTDPNLVNAWGLSFGPSTPAWVADNGTDVSTLYSGASSAAHAVTTVPLVVRIPQGAPTGTVFNGGDGFAIDGSPSRFLFSSEAGVISGWNPSFGTDARTGAVAAGAIYKGLAIAGTANGPRLYATDFHDNRVDVWDGTFSPAGKPGGFTDPKLPDGFAPFGIQAVGSQHRRHLRQAGRRRRGRTARPRPRVRRRLRHQRHPDQAARVARAPERALGHRARAEALREGQQGPPDRQLRRRPHQRVRPAPRALRGRAEQGQARAADRDRRAVGTRIRQRHDRHAADAAVHRRTGRRTARTVRRHHRGEGGRPLSHRTAVVAAPEPQASRGRDDACSVVR